MKPVLLLTYLGQEDQEPVGLMRILLLSRQLWMKPPKHNSIFKVIY